MPWLRVVYQSGLNGGRAATEHDVQWGLYMCSCVSMTLQSIVLYRAFYTSHVAYKFSQACIVMVASPKPALCCFVHCVRYFMQGVVQHWCASRACFHVCHAAALLCTACVLSCVPCCSTAVHCVCVWFYVPWCSSLCAGPHCCSLLERRAARAQRCMLAAHKHVHLWTQACPVMCSYVLMCVLTVCQRDDVTHKLLVHHLAMLLGRISGS